MTCKLSEKRITKRPTAAGCRGDIHPHLDDRRGSSCFAICGGGTAPAIGVCAASAGQKSVGPAALTVWAQVISRWTNAVDSNGMATTLRASPVSRPTTFGNVDHRAVFLGTWRVSDPGTSVEWLSANCSAYIAKDTLDTATALGLKLCFTPVRSLESNGIAEAFVKTFRCDYARLSILPDVRFQEQP